MCEHQQNKDHFFKYPFIDKYFGTYKSIFNHIILPCTL